MGIFEPSEYHPGIYCKPVVLDILRDRLEEMFQCECLDEQTINAMEAAATNIMNKVCTIYNIRESFKVKITQDRYYPSALYIEVGPDSFIKKLDETIAAIIRKELVKNVIQPYWSSPDFTEKKILPS